MIHPLPPPEDIIAVTPNLNRRLSGVTSTIARLVPIQAKMDGVVAAGIGLPDHVPKLRLSQLLKLGYQPTRDGKPRIFHARRNIEMLLGIFLRYILRQNYRLLFTSASQRKHTLYTKTLISMMDHVIATSSATAAYLQVPNTVIMHGIDLQEFSPPQDKSKKRKALQVRGNMVIGCFGRIRAQKGTDLFVQALIDVLPSYPEATGLIMGRATQSHINFQNQLLHDIKAAGLADRIIFAGEAPVDKIEQYYQTLSIFVAPQRWEGFGLTPLEAMACRIPVIASKVGAFPEIIDDGKNGYLTDPGDKAQLVEKLHLYLKDHALRAKHADAGLDQVRSKFQLKTEAVKILEIYRQMRKDNE